MKTLKQRFTFRRVGGVLVALAASPAAFAQTGGFDQADIISEVTTYGAAAVAIVTAILLVRWGLHAMGVLRPRG